MDAKELSVFVEQCQDGDSQAFEVVFKETISWVQPIVSGIVIDEESVSECVQDIYVLVWEKIGVLQDPMAFLAWLKRIAVNRSLRYAKKGNRQRARVVSTPIDEVHEAAASSPSPEVAISNRLTLMQALRALSPKERSLLVIRELQGASYEELAKIFAVPLGTIRSRLSSARKKAQSFFESEVK